MRTTFPLSFNNSIKEKPQEMNLELGIEVLAHPTHILV